MDTSEAFAFMMLDKPECPEEIETAYNMYVRAADLGTVYGITYICSKGHCHVVVNPGRSEEQQEISYFHEAYHCLGDYPSSAVEWAAEDHAWTIRQLMCRRRE
ncbi:MAG TPA: hypothetical protein GXX40_05510 [Firmicutes bacterium]|nr:hypothetical protein [Bacillota bacterium]